MHGFWSVDLALGMQLQRGTELMVDQSPRLNAPYVVCVTDGCVSDYEATLELISKLKNGHGLLVQVISGSGQVVSFVLPLSDFAQAYDGPPTDAAAFEDR
jgi:invasion protein IalB